jgi:hypothetical protein
MWLDFIEGEFFLQYLGPMLANEPDDLVLQLVSYLGCFTHTVEHA